MNPSTRPRRGRTCPLFQQAANPRRGAAAAGRARALLCRAIPLAILACGAVAPARGQDAPPAIDADVLLRGGQLLDGSGSPAVAGDVAIRGDRIVAVGQFTVGQVGRSIDCTGQVVAPGFIDLHNHSDDSIVGDQTRTAENYIRQATP